MLDGLRREFPEVITFARALPHPRVARASPFWSMMAAFGAGFFASGIVTILVSLLFRLTTRETPLPAPFELAGLAGTAAALAVAWVGGGRTTVAGYLGVLALERLLGLPGQLRFCGEFGGFAVLGGQLCSVGGYLIALWPQLLGVAVAIALARWLRTGPGDRNPTLEAAGIYALVQTLGGTFLNLILGPATVGSPVWPISFLLLAIAGGAAVGYTVVRRATRKPRTARDRRAGDRRRVRAPFATASREPARPGARHEPHRACRAARVFFAGVRDRRRDDRPLHGGGTKDRHHGPMNTVSPSDKMKASRGYASTPSIKPDRFAVLVHYDVTPRE